MSWIAIDDLARMFLFALENKELKGIYNAVGPKPATNEALTQKAAKKVGKFYMGLGVPGFALKLVLGEMAQRVLGGNKVSAKKIRDAGFEFRYPSLEEALDKIYSSD